MLLRSCAGEGTSVVLEEVTWLVRMAAHLIADPGEGETPLPPLTIAAAASQACQAGQQDPLAALSWALLDVASLCADPATTSIVSPRCCTGPAYGQSLLSVPEQ